MSNKLVKPKKQVKKVTEKQKKIIFTGSFIVLSIAFIVVWMNIFLTSSVFKEKMNRMVLGVDYFLEDVEITDKRMESDVNEPMHENYFFYYKNGRVYDYHKRMQVPKKIYSEYQVGDTITAYTTNHVEYSYEKYGILPKTDFKNNELMKCVGVLLGVGIFMLILIGVWNNKTSDF